VTILLITIPLVAALVAFVVPREWPRPWIVAATAVVHTVLAFRVAMFRERVTGFLGWFQFDALGLLVLLVISTLFLLCAVYLIGYLRLRAERPNRVFCTSVLVFLGMMSALVAAQHLMVMWVAMEATTLSTALLLYFNQNHRSLEAT
jgi:NADH:ubiquinone oxidoreductase subunit 5 (chain L)/Multisubunit Na+/H+ antiporter, MnhA subunit